MSLRGGAVTGSAEAGALTLTLLSPIASPMPTKPANVTSITRSFLSLARFMVRSFVRSGDRYGAKHKEGGRSVFAPDQIGEDFLAYPGGGHYATACVGRRHSSGPSRMSKPREARARPKARRSSKRPLHAGASAAPMRAKAAATASA